MLVALAAEVGDPFAAQEGVVALYSRRHRPSREITVGLAVPLAVEDVRAQGFEG